MPERTLHTIEVAVRQSWGLDTCDPIDVPNWSPDRPSRGQCAVTALVVRDLVGGELLEAEVHFLDGRRQGFHYWNRLPGGIDVDLTAEQFSPDEAIQEPKVVERPPGPPLRGAEQYEIFRTRVRSALGLTA